MKNLKTNDIRYVIYARRSIEKSDKEDKVLSIDSQIKELRELALQENLKIVTTFYETGSAKKPYKRPEFQKMIEFIQKDKADGILCWKVDRLARNAVDEGTIKYLLQTEIIKNIRSTDRDWWPDDNALLASVEFGVATQYSRDLSKHVKRGLRARLESGVRPSIAPLGYKNSKYHEKGKEEILVDEERFPLIRQLFDLMLTGAYSPLELTKIANDKLGLTNRHAYTSKRIGKSNIYRILNNPFYYGCFEYPWGSGNWYQGNHKAMITKKEYDEVQSIISNNGRPRTQKHEFAFTGLIRCGECGAMITAEEKFKYQQNGNTHRYVYYHCTKRVNKNCMQKSVREKVLETEIVNVLKKMEVPKLFHEWAIETLKEMHEKEKKERNSMVSTKRKEYEDITFKLDRLLEIRMANEITAKDFQQKKFVFEQQKLAISNILDNLDQQIDTWMHEVESSLTFAEKARKEFEDGDSKKKKEILGSLGYNHLLKDGKLNVLMTKPLFALEKGINLAKSISDRLEPPRSVAMQGRIKQKYSENDEMWRCRESNPGAIETIRTILQC